MKEDYKPEIRWVPELPRHSRSHLWLAMLGLVTCGFSAYVYSQYTTGSAVPMEALDHLPADREQMDSGLADNDLTSSPITTISTIENTDVPEIKSLEPEAVPWHSVTIKRGDNLSLIFDRAGLTPVNLYKVMMASKDSALLTRLMPGNEIKLHIHDGQLQALLYEPDLTRSLQISRQGDEFSGELIITELDKKSKEISVVIEDSLFLAGQDAGLSDNLIMRFVSIYGWDIDFALDIRSGDEFRIIYEELFKDGIKVKEGNILATEFTNRGKTFRALRYTDPDGETGYFNEEGFSMRKAFLRTPVKFSRISSRFNLRRKHPVLNTIRAHKGVDYAAPTGTPVKATGNGTVVFAGRDGGYGNAVTLRHGGIYKTVYAHLSRFARGIKKGKHIKQGDIIGYVGKTGLATGPHLHYEFRVNGAHRNPLKVKLPKAMKIPEKYMPHFKTRASSMLARLDNTAPEHVVLALQESGPAATAVH